MSLAAATCAGAGRAGLAGALAVALAWPLRHALHGHRRRARQAPLAAALALAVAVPPLAVAYAATTLAPRLALAPGLSSWVLLALLVGRVLPFVALVLALLPPPPLWGAAAHALALLPADAPLRRQAWRWRLTAGAAGPGAFALAVGFALAFADFELTARFGQASWTVWLFDAQAGGVDVTALVWQTVGPLALTSTVLGLGGAYAAKVGAAPRDAGTAPGSIRPGRLARASSDRARLPRRLPLALVPLALTLAIVVLLPLALLAADGAPHLADALRSPAARHELLWSLAYALTAAVGADGMARGLVGRSLPRRRDLVALLASMPGIAGSLALALAIRSLCPATLADTPLPALAALALAALPYAVVLRLALRRAPDSSTHAATLLAPLDAGRRRVAALVTAAQRGHPTLWSLAVLVPLALQDVVIGAILAPPQAAPLTVRLHNLAHYGHSHTVSAQMLLLVAAGVLPLGVATAADAFRRRRPRL